MIIHVIAAPYTKVEETFQVNNIRDHLHLGIIDISTYDFIEFPGVVFRTFISSLMVAAVAWPFKPILSIMGFNCYHMLVLCKTNFLMNHIGRIILGMMNIGALKVLKVYAYEKYRDKHLNKAFSFVTDFDNGCIKVYVV
jgi:alpha-1,6-mannosyltransferase